MATYTNNTEETFVFPSLGLVIAPGESFETGEKITTDGFKIASGKAPKVVTPAVPVEPEPAPELPELPEPDAAPPAGAADPLDPAAADPVAATP